MNKWIRIGNEWFHDNGSKVTILDNNVVLIDNMSKDTISCKSFMSFDKAEFFVVALTMTPKIFE